MNQEMPEISSTQCYVTTSAQTEDDDGTHMARRIQFNAPKVGADVFQKIHKAVEDHAREDFYEDEVMKRLVRVFVVDPDDRIDIEQSLLYDSKEHMTDLDDQELFFEIDIKILLEKHNKYRGEVIDKEVKERTEYLEPVRIRELRMTVVTLAEFGENVVRGR